MRVLVPMACFSFVGVLVLRADFRFAPVLRSRYIDSMGRFSFGDAFLVSRMGFSFGGAF